jgi:hypothetical protein
MNAKRIFSLLLFLFGEGLIILCFIHFGKNIQPEILKLNIVVASLIYILSFFDIFIPWIDLKDKPQKKIGSIGLRWVFTTFYMITGVGAMIIFNTLSPIPFISQLIIQGILLFLLLIGLFLAFSSSEKVQEIYQEERQILNKIDEMKKTTRELQLKLDRMTDIPVDVILRINNLQENIRFLSPCNNNRATELEKQFVEEMRMLHDCFVDIPLNIAKIQDNIKNCERTYKERKQVFSD